MSRTIVLGGFSVLAAICSALSLKTGLQEILSKLIRYSKYMPAEKIYVHLDRSLYAPGEDIWFSSYIINAYEPKAGAFSEIIYVELLDSKSQLTDRKIVHVADGVAAGDFKLSDKLVDGNYTVRAYTNYLKNFGESWFFQKPIAIHSIQENEPVGQENKTAAKINLQFFPEGGTFLPGIENRIALKATNENGEDIAVKGKIIDSNKKLVTYFESVHAGMGMVKLIPTPNSSYKAIIDGDSVTYPMPKVEAEGFNLRVTDLGKTIKVAIVTTAKRLIDHDVYLIIQSNGIPHFSARGTLSNGSLVTYVKKELFPSGVAQVTVLDELLTPQCERLVFVNHFDSPKISISFNKEGYQKREKIVMKGSVIDSKGLPVAGHFSMSVFDSDKIKDTEEYPSTIESSFLLTSDLKGLIHNPGYYFKDTLQSTKYHLDLLMMTHGWRRFTWKNVLNDSLPQLSFMPEKGLGIGGKVGRQNSKKKNQYGGVKILTPDGYLIMVKTNDLGEFYTDRLLYYDSANLVVETDNDKGEQQDLNLTLFPFTPSPPFGLKLFPQKTDSLSSFIDLANSSKQVNDAIKMEQGTILLEGVVIKSTRIEEENKSLISPMGIKPSIRVTSRQLLEGYSNVLDALKGLVPGVEVSGDNMSHNYIINIRNSPAQLLFDGMRVDADFMSTVPKGQIDHIDVIKEGGYGGIRSEGGVIAFYSKNYAGTVEVKGLAKIKYPGLSRAREFYSPNYAVPDNCHKYPDFRSTLYWNSNIKTDSTGRFEVSFYSGDVVSHYKAIIEGISVDGIPASANGMIIMH